MDWMEENKKSLEERANRLRERKQPKMPDNSGADFFDVQGHLEVLKVYPDGHQETFQEGQNTITNKGKEAFSRLLGAVYGGLTADEWRPSVIILGSGTVGTPETAENIDSVLQSTVSNTELSSYYWRDPNGRMDSSEITLVNTNQLQIETVLGPGEGSGNWLNSENASAVFSGTAGNSTITEAGLYFLDDAAFPGGTTNNMIAYKTFSPSIAYDSSETDFSLLFRWTISFSNPA